MNRLQLTILAILLTARVAFAAEVSFPECGITFNLPRDWRAHVTDGVDQGSSIRCSLELEPTNWEVLAEKSRWNVGPPITVKMFLPGTPLERALEETGFDQNEDNTWGIAGRLVRFTPAARYRRGRFRGLVGYASYRGFAKDSAVVGEDDSRVFTGGGTRIVVKDGNGKVVGFDCDGGAPDLTTESEPVVNMFLRTLRVSEAAFDPSGALRSKQLQRAGTVALDCGDVPPDGARTAVEACMVAAFDADKPFHARFWLKGIDSSIAEGVALAPKHELFIYWFDSAPCGGPGCAARLDERRCQKPYVWRGKGGRHVACAEPPFNQDFQPAN